MFLPNEVVSSTFLITFFFSCYLFSSSVSYTQVPLTFSLSCEMCHVLASAFDAVQYQIGFSWSTHVTRPVIYACHFIYWCTTLLSVGSLLPQYCLSRLCTARVYFVIAVCTVCLHSRRHLVTGASSISYVHCGNKLDYGKYCTIGLNQMLPRRRFLIMNWGRRPFCNCASLE
jgi:hypothetical protein